jgi:putative transcriptional regulator
MIRSPTFSPAAGSKTPPPNVIPPAFDDLKTQAAARSPGEQVAFQRRMAETGEDPAAAPRFTAPVLAQDVRKKLGLTQPVFARLLGIPVATLRNWEQNRFVMEPAAKTLLTLIDREPKAALCALRGPQDCPGDGPGAGCSTRVARRDTDGQVATSSRSKATYKREHASALRYLDPRPELGVLSPRPHTSRPIRAMRRLFADQRSATPCRDSGLPALGNHRKS